jgi:hypothetical protein
MPHQRETATDQLLNVIQVIQLGRKTGTLTVERGEGSGFEEGMITFVHGRATQAKVGQRVGAEAFKWLSSWGPCRFAFISTSSNGIALSHASPTNTLKDTDSNLHAHRSPVNQQDGFLVRDTGGRIGMWPANGLPPVSTAPRRVSQLEEAFHLIEYLGLSRAHRRMFLLIDGYRSTSELVRLTGREEGEVRRLLSELERAGLIQQ